MEYSYKGRHAELYDLFYEEKPYAEEAAFVADCLRQFGHATPRRLLELACGTGRHAIEKMMAGATAVGIGTAVYTRGITVFEKVCREMYVESEFLGIEKISAVIGTAAGQLQGFEAERS